MKTHFTMKTIFSIGLLLIMLLAAMGTSTISGSLQHRSDELEERIHRLKTDVDDLETKISDLEKRATMLKQE